MMQLNSRQAACKSHVVARHFRSNVLVACRVSETGASTTRVHVINIPWSMSEQDLKTAFSRAGEVTDVDLWTDHNGKLKGMGTVRFATSQEAAHAVKVMDGAQVSGRVLKVEPSYQPEDSKPKRRALFTSAIRDALDMSNADDTSDILLPRNARTTKTITSNAAPPNSISPPTPTAEKSRRTTDQKRTFEADTSSSSSVTRKQWSNDTPPSSSAARTPRSDDKPRSSKSQPREPKPQIPEDPLEERRLFVSFLSWDTKWDDLKDHFRKAGEVLYSRVLTDESGKSRGSAILEMETAAGAQKAIQMFNETELDGRTIKVRMSDPRSSEGKPGNRGAATPVSVERKPRRG